MRAMLLVLALPICVSAEEVYVDLAGKVTEVNNRPPGQYEKGDPISGRLVIDTVLAGTDHHPDDPTIGHWGSRGFFEPSVDFVNGYFDATQYSAYRDTVLVRNDEVATA